MSLEINYIDAPAGVQKNMTAVGEGGNTISDETLIPKGARDIPWATLEPGEWKLDGTYRIMPEDCKPGWWSKARSGQGEYGGVLGRNRLGKFVLGSPGADGKFTTPPKLTLTFPTPYSASGFTFTFSPSTDQWCTEIRVAWHNGQFPILEKTYYPDSARWLLEEVIESFDKIEIWFISTNQPGQFAKVQRIEVGKAVLFDGAAIISARLVNELDPSLCDLTVDTSAVEVCDPLSRDLLPQENQQMEIRKDGELLSTHYIKKSTRKAKNRYAFDCQSAIGLLTEEFLGGMYADAPLDEVLAAILGDWVYEIAPIFADRTITGYIPVCTQRQALQQVAFAIGAMVSTQGTNLIRLLPVPTVVAGKFEKNEIVLGGSVTAEPRFAKMDVHYHTYTKQAEVETLLDEEAVNGENVLFTFPSPHYDYEITGGEITGSDVNWVTITANGTVTLTAKGYLHNSFPVEMRNQEATDLERGNSISVKECTLIHSGNVEAALYRLYGAKRLRQTAKQTVIVSDQRAGQILSSLTPWDTTVQGFVTSMESKLTRNGHTAAIEIQGVEIAMEAVWLYSGELYSDGQEVVY